MNPKKKENDTRVGIWLDHHVAHIVHRNSEGVFVKESLTSDLISRPRFRGEETDKTQWGRSMVSDNESKRNNRAKGLTRSFYKELEKKLSAYNHILISGPTTAASELHHHLQNVKSFKGKSITEDKSPEMTTRQLMAYMKKQLGKPMDIFRQDEII